MVDAYNDSVMRAKDLLITEVESVVSWRRVSRVNVHKKATSDVDSNNVMRAMKASHSLYDGK